MSSTLKVFKKEIIVKLEGNTEHDIKYAFRHIEEFITPRFYNCDAKVIESNRVKIRIKQCEDRLEKLNRTKSFREFLEEETKTVENEIQRLKSLLTEGEVNNYE